MLYFSISTVSILHFINSIFYDGGGCSFTVQNYRMNQYQFINVLIPGAIEDLITLLDNLIEQLNNYFKNRLNSNELNILLKLFYKLAVECIVPLIKTIFFIINILTAISIIPQIISSFHTIYDVYFIKTFLEKWSFSNYIMDYLAVDSPSIHVHSMKCFIGYLIDIQIINNMFLKDFLSPSKFKYILNQIDVMPYNGIFIDLIKYLLKTIIEIVTIIIRILNEIERVLEMIFVSIFGFNLVNSGGDYVNETVNKPSKIVLLKRNSKSNPPIKQNSTKVINVTVATK
jgi:hypothetical protein